MHRTGYRQQNGRLATPKVLREQHHHFIISRSARENCKGGTAPSRVTVSCVTPGAAMPLHIHSINRRNGPVKLSSSRGPDVTESRPPFSPKSRNAKTRQGLISTPNSLSTWSHSVSAIAYEKAGSQRPPSRHFETTPRIAHGNSFNGLQCSSQGHVHDTVLCIRLRIRTAGRCKGGSEEVYDTDYTLRLMALGTAATVNESGCALHCR